MKTTTKAEVSALIAADAALVITGAPVTVLPPAGKGKKARKPATTSVIASTVGAPDHKPSNKLIAEAFVGPVLPVAAKAKASVPHGAGYCFTELTDEVAAKNTLQRSGAGFGAAWRKNGKVDTSIRYQALAALADAADEDGYVSREAALAALAHVPLGCSSPAVRLAKFVRSGHLEVVA